jgi:hypothetical protein
MFPRRRIAFLGRQPGDLVLHRVAVGRDDQFAAGLMADTESDLSVRIFARAFARYQAAIRIHAIRAQPLARSLCKPMAGANPPRARPSVTKLRPASWVHMRWEEPRRFRIAIVQPGEMSIHQLFQCRVDLHVRKRSFGCGRSKSRNKWFANEARLGIRFWRRGASVRISCVRCPTIAS